MAFALFVVAAGYGQMTEQKTLTLERAEQAIATTKMEAQKLQAPGVVIAV